MTTVFADEYGYNAQDATAALQAAIDDPNADRIIVRDTGSPWLISKQIKLKSNKEIVFEEGSVVRAKPGSFLANDKAMIVGRNVENVKLIGQGEGENKATLKMNKEEYNTSQYGHIISLLGVDGYEVSGLKLTGAGGDGLHLAAGSYERPKPGTLPYAANGLVENITSDNNRRQGISIDSAKNLVVRNSSFTNTSGTRPSSGISLEPTWDFESLQNIKIENVEISGNDRIGIQMLLGNIDTTSAPVSVDFNNITLEDSAKGAIFVTGKYLANGSDYGSEFKGEPNQNSPNGDINGTVNFNNINISNADRIKSGKAGDNPGTYVFVEGISGKQNDPNNLKVNFDNLNIKDPVDTPVRTTPVFIQGLGGENNPKEVGNISFNDVTIEGNYSTDVVRADMLRADGNFNNISGDITVLNSGSGKDFFLKTPNEGKNFDLSVNEGSDRAPVVANEIEPIVADNSEVAAEPAIEPDVASQADEVVEPVPVAEPIVADNSEVATEPAIEPDVAENGEVVEPVPAIEPEELVADDRAVAKPIEPITTVEADETADIPVAEPFEPVTQTIAEDTPSTDIAKTTPQSTEVRENSVTAGEDNSNLTNSNDETEANSDSIYDPVIINETEANSDSIYDPVIINDFESSIPIQNSSFSDGLTGWNSTGGDISTVERSAGDRWVKIASPIGGISQDITDRIEGGEDYEIAATTDFSESGTRGYIGARFTNSSGKLLALKYTPVNGGAVQEAVSCTAPKGFDRVEAFAFKNDGSSTFFVDDFSLTEQ